MQPIFSGLEDVVDLPPGETIPLLDGVSASLQDGTALRVCVENIVASGDPDFVCTEEMRELLAPAEGARYRVTYGAYDAGGERIGEGEKNFLIRDGRPSQEVVLRDEDYLFSFSGTNPATILRNTRFECLRAVSLTVECRDSDRPITEEEIDNYEIEVTEIRSEDPGYTYREGETSFISCDQYGIRYTISYAVRSASSGRLVEGLAAQKILTVSKPVGTLPFLDNDDEYISEFRVSAIGDGTSPFDGDDAPGHDSGAGNRIVRSYDSVTYTLAVTSEAYTQGAYYKKGYIRFRFVLPLEEELACFDLSSMGWMTRDSGSEYDYRLEKEEIDGRAAQVLYASKYLDPETAGQSNALPVIEQMINVTILISGMRNGDSVTPAFYAWMDHNTQEGACKEHDREELVMLEPEPVSVSAAPSYNIKIENEREASGATFDFDRGTADAQNKGKGIVDGALFQYGISLELVNPGDAARGLRGIEIPQGEISFDIELGTRYRYGEKGEEISLSDKDGYRPLLWVAGGNTWNTSGSFDRDVRELGYALEDVVIYSPYNHGHYYNACDGGTWRVTQEGNTLHVTVKDYQIDPYDFPYQAAYGDVNSSKYYSRELYGKGPQVINTGIFSVGQFYIVAPYGSGEDYLASRYGAGSVFLSVKADGLQAVSVSGQQAQGQAIAGDDEKEDSYALRMPGSFNNYIQYTVALDPSVHASLQPFMDVDDSLSKANNGKDAVALGQFFTISYGCSFINRNENALYGADTLMKFDEEAMTPVIDESRLSQWAENGAEHSSGYVQGLTHTTLYAAKEDGTGWKSDEEMEAAGIGDMRYYATLEELRGSGALCTGILQQIRTDNPLPGTRHGLSGVLFQAKTDLELTGRVYQTVVRSNAYMGTAKEYRGKIPSILDWQNHGAKMPRATHSDWITTDYQKAAWENGRYAGGDNTCSDNGDSLYLMAYRAQISKSVEQRSGSQNKSVFDLDNGQDTVDILLRPSLVSEVAGSSLAPTTMTVTDVIPKGTSYNGDAVYGGTYTISEKEGYHGTVTGGKPITPVITQNEAGESVLTWTLPDTPVSQDLPAIRYSVTIDRVNVTHSQYFTSSATIETTEDGRDKETVAGNLSAAGFRVVKLSGLSISKEADRFYNNTGEDIGFSLNWQNFTQNDVSGVVMADTMPYSGDDAGSSFNGTYSIA
ncbi:MAG: hypothetical protein Q4C60_10825, partial [Eubacteriales bacterium]|nr:hypothetical protein [Eubacteriales bacterium]